MIDISIFIRETQGIQRKADPVSFGVPFRQGALDNTNKLKLIDQAKELPCNLVATAYWPDKSVKWALLHGQVDLNKNEYKTLQLKESDVTNEINDKLEIREQKDHYLINTGCEKFILFHNSLVPLPLNYSNTKKEHITLANVVLTKTEKQIATVSISNRRIVNQGLTSSIIFEGIFLDENSNDEKLPPKFELTITFYANKSLVKWQFTMTNPNAALHPGGRWDLGDKGSYFFKDLSIEMPLSESATTSYKDQVHSQKLPIIENNFSLFQCSSGGENWFSQNHVNKSGHVPLKFKGYQVSNGKEEAFNGERASPYLFVEDTDIDLALHIENFWQNFPKAITVKQNKLRLSLFPQESADDFELQAGEQKTHRVYVDFSKNQNDLLAITNPIEISLSPQYLSNTNAVSWLCGDIEHNALTNIIIDNGLNKANNFFNKREIIDEFGWRNFGEVYADHESLGHTGKTPLISHYNNQYDPILGFARMYFQTSDNRWLELMNDLAQHVVDIDIYNTEQDRDEYNHGLFWHTDHYLDAETCTHRTFSKHHKAVYQDHTGGGGPGAEHCYTAGLATHYFLTGSEQSKKTVLNLADWFISFQEGNGSFLARLLEVKQKDLKIIKRLLKKESILKTKYPLTRGTSNYICTLMDAYSLTGDKEYITRVEKIICQTIHPNEDISLRNLHNKELTWSYLIVLQGLTKYLALKESLQAFDDMYFYARESLLLYTEWMMENEEPYLDKPELLEFPNKTWVAQDLRKANILFIASQYSDKKDLYITKAQQFFDYVSNTLKDDKEAELSRILILLMQNQGPESCLTMNSAIPKNNKIKKTETVAPTYSIMGCLVTMIVDLTRSLINFSYKKEKQWLKFRMK